MKTQLTALAVVTAMTLVGCSGGTVSATSDQAQSSSTAHDSIVSRIKTFFKSEEQTVTVEMPAASLIVEAAKDWIAENKVEMNMPVDISVNSCLYSPEVRDILGYEQEPDYTLKHVLEEQIEPNSKHSHLLKLDTNKICARMFIRDSAIPFGGWYRDVDHGDFARAIFLNAFVTNGLETQIITRLGTTVWKSDVEAKQRINAILDELVDSGAYFGIVAEGAKQTELSLSKDFTGSSPAPVHFQIGDYDVSGSGIGSSMLRNGSEWFGAGFISWKKYTVAMKSVEVAAMKKEKAIAAGESTKTETKVGEGAGVAN